MVELIHSGAYEYDERIIITSTTQADHLRGLTKMVPTEEEMFQRVCRIEPTFVNLGIQLQHNTKGDEPLNLDDNEDKEKYDLSKMVPKVTYDDWVICLYEEDSKLYYVTEEYITPVKVVGLFEYNDEFEAEDEDGNIIEEDDLPDYIDCLCCGEADDMSCYVYFDTCEKEELPKDTHLKRISVLTCTHETKHGVDTFVSLHPNREAAFEHIEAVQANCDYNPKNPERNEYFDYEVEEQVIDINSL